MGRFIDPFNDYWRDLFRSSLVLHHHRFSGYTINLVCCTHIYFNDLIYVEALQNYVTLFTLKGKYITQLPLKNVEQNLSGQQFIRVHKSFIVSIPKIEAIENNEIIIQSHRIPISRHYRDQVMNNVVNDKLWKK